MSAAIALTTAKLHTINFKSKGPVAKNTKSPVRQGHNPVGTLFKASTSGRGNYQMYFRICSAKITHHPPEKLPTMPWTL